MGTKSSNAQSTARSKEDIRRDIHNLNQILSRKRHPLTKEQKRIKSIKWKAYYEANKIKINNQRAQRKRDEKSLV